MNSVPNAANNNRMRFRRRQTRQSARQISLPTLRFTPTAWSKLLFLRDCGESEVGGFGIAAVDDLLRVEEVRLIQQSCTSVTVRFDD